MPDGYTHITPGGGTYRCQDCRHDRPTTSMPWISRCDAGVVADGAAGHWRSDPRDCESFEHKNERSNDESI